MSMIYNVDGNTVTATLVDCKDDALNVIKKAVIRGYHGDTEGANSKIECYGYLKDKYVGKARCHPDDEFSIEKGKKIAKKRCLRKYRKDFYKQVNRFRRELLSVVSKIPVENKNGFPNW